MHFRILKNMGQLLMLFALTLSSAGPAASKSAWQNKVEPSLLQAAAQGHAEFLVLLAEQADLSLAESMPTKLDKGQFVYQRLSETARRTQEPLLAALEKLGIENQPFWVANMVWVRGDQAALQILAQRSDVAFVYNNPLVKLDLPAQTPSPELFSTTSIEWNVNKVNSPAVWAAGYTGQGVVIGGQDTGYQWDHPGLKTHYRGWNGASADHNYSWHDAIHSGAVPSCPANSTIPCDDFGHGTHTMGTMVGDDGAGNQVGVAPGAKWIGCRNMNSGYGTPASYAECYQWFIAPTDLNGANPRPDLAPDVINNSWGCPPNEGCTDPNVLLQAIQSVRAAGILTVHSAGNSGSSCSTVNTPAAIYGGSFTVGATSVNDVIASFSSRGPVTADGSGRAKPNVTAPGLSVRSTTLGGGYGSMNGTSMAAPHVVGVAALLLSAEPALRGQVDAIETLIEQSAVRLDAGSACSSTPGQYPNNVYGWGRVDAWAGYQAVQHRLSVANGASAAAISAGSLLTYTLTVSHTQGYTATTGVVITNTLPAGTSLWSATPAYSFLGNTLRWNFPILGQNQHTTVQLVVSVPITASGDITNDAYGAASDQVQPPVSGPPVSTRVIGPIKFYLQFLTR